MNKICQKKEQFAEVFVWLVCPIILFLLSHFLPLWKADCSFVIAHEMYHLVGICRYFHMHLHHTYCFLAGCTVLKCKISNNLKILFEMFSYLIPSYHLKKKKNFCTWKSIWKQMFSLFLWELYVLLFSNKTKVVFHR